MDMQHEFDNAFPNLEYVPGPFFQKSTAYANASEIIISPLTRRF